MDCTPKYILDWSGDFTPKKLECQIHWQGLGKHLVDNAPSVGILRFSKNPVDARDKNFQQRAESLSLAGASEGHCHCH